jgi:hypothetical protein
VPASLDWRRLALLRAWEEREDWVWGGLLHWPGWQLPVPSRQGCRRRLYCRERALEVIRAGVLRHFMQGDVQELCQCQGSRRLVGVRLEDKGPSCRRSQLVWWDRGCIVLLDKVIAVTARPAEGKSRILFPGDVCSAAEQCLHQLRLESMFLFPTLRASRLLVMILVE